MSVWWFVGWTWLVLGILSGNPALTILSIVFFVLAASDDD